MGETEKVEVEDAIAGERTIKDVLMWIFPNGTTNESFAGASGEDKIRSAPTWAPDLFAAAAILIERSGCYTHPSFDALAFSEPDLDLAEVVAGYRLGPDPAPDDSRWVKSYGAVSDKWRRLVTEFGDVSSRADLRSETPPEWCAILIDLLTIADIACDGVGFLTDPGEDHNVALQISLNQRKHYHEEHKARHNRIVGIKSILESDFEQVSKILENYCPPNIVMKHILHSICFKVPSYIACVQPKANTPQVGFTIRSLSHNLALLPPQGEVATFWFNSFPDASHNPGYINILLVPYPYHIDGSCFEPISRNPKTKERKFKLYQRWLEDLGDEPEIQAGAIRDGLKHLIKIAKRDTGRIDGVVFPELSLSHSVAELASGKLFAEPTSATFESPDFFISGVSSHRMSMDGSHHKSKREGRHINSVYTRLKFKVKNSVGSFETINLRRLQVKHHRWKFTKDQVVRYHLGPHLSPDHDWWEDTDIIERENLFWVFRPNLVMSSLVCEDLARIDPVQQVLRSVSPNLVVALLLDGAQKIDRWSSRYATSLSDDPGCGVLTLTSLGMIRRSHDYSSAPESRQIAIWKDYAGVAKELNLPKHAAALVITLSITPVAEKTIYGRDQSLEFRSNKLTLSGIRAICITDQSDTTKMFRDLNKNL